jgi:hypothetical protein
MPAKKTTPAAPVAEVAPEVAPVAEVTPTLTLAVDHDAVLAAEVAEVLPVLTLAALDRVHVLRVETRTEEETTRVRMRCDCGRNSYFAEVTEAGVLPTNVREALRRHNRRALGKAMRVVRADASLLARLAEAGGEPEIAE